jgi:long-chain acyl-CoA synthetase
MSTISHEFFRQAYSVPEKIAISCDGNQITYIVLAHQVSRLSCAMRSKGVTRGDHIGVLLPNSIEFVQLMLVAADIGAVLVPFNISLPPSAVEKAFLAANIKHVVASSSVLNDLLENSISNFSSADGLWLAVGESVHEIETLEKLINGTEEDVAPSMLAMTDDPYIFTMTSGSTGNPKPIILTQRTKLNRIAAAVDMYSVNSEDKTLAATPLYHSLAERLVLMPLLTGGTSVIMSRFSPSEWLNIVAEQEVSFTIAVSSQLNQIANSLIDSNFSRIASLRCVVSSSALLDIQVKERIVTNFGCEFHECYGTSEIAIATSLNISDYPEKLRSVGHAAAGVEIRIIGEDDRAVATGDVGEIVCKTAMIFGGYYEQPTQTCESMWGDFFRTGDLGRLDADGFLFFLGRKKEIIITGGINVYPADVESAIEECGLTHEVAAFSIPDERLGEAVAVALVPKSSESFNLKRIRIDCAAHLADYQLPRKWFVMDTLPKNPMGKIMRSELQAQYRSNGL